MKNFISRTLIGLAIGLLAPSVALSQTNSSTAAQADGPERPIRIHDPSTLIKCGEDYWVFATGVGLVSAKSRDLLNWERGPSVWKEFPVWKQLLVPENKNGHLWAPDIVHRDGRFWLYYSVSTLGKRVSVIALATNATLNPHAPDFAWKDAGVVVRTTEADNHNAIDPSIAMDHAGRPWMTYGSYWSGIKLIELDPVTGLRLSTNSPQYSLAWKEAIEAACLHRKDENYFLFVNWGQCCRGTNSTYEIRVGRSDKITGPYLDQTGKDMMQGGGSPFLATQGKRIGPGHTAVFHKEGKEYFSYHYYDGENAGRHTLEIAPLLWKDGWPVAGKPLRP